MKIPKGAGTVRDDPVRIKYRGLYDLMGLSNTVQAYFGSLPIDMKVAKFKWKGKEGEWSYFGVRKINEYIRISLYCDCYWWVIREQEVVEDGQKVKKFYGKLHIEVNAAFEHNYGKTFDESKGLQKRMKDVLDNPADGLQFGDLKVGGEKYMEKNLDKFVETIKKYLGMECLT